MTLSFKEILACVKVQITRAAGLSLQYEKRGVFLVEGNTKNDNFLVLSGRCAGQYLPLSVPVAGESKQ